jgi:molecular chaperone Hsp33
MADTVLRAIADDGSFRVIAALTTETVRGAIEAQRVAGVTASFFGELLTGSILIRETMAPQLRVQGILRSGLVKGGSMVADSHPDGSARGLVSEPLRGADMRLDGAVLQMMRTLHNGALQQGIVEFAGETISAALMEYLQTSEQVASSIAVAALREREQVVLAGGYLVQLLPEAEPEALATMTERLTRLPSIESLLASGKASPRELIAALLDGTRFTYLDESSLRFLCYCSKERLMSSLATIDAAELQDMINEGGHFDITCDYCNREYKITPDDLRGLLN